MKDWERNISALAHLLVLLPLWGIVFAGILWIRFREESRAIVFQVLQAIFFQITLLVLTIVYILFQMFCGVIKVLDEQLSLLLQTGNAYFFYLVIIIYVAGCLSAAISILMGRDFHYPLIGEKVKEGMRRKEAK